MVLFNLIYPIVRFPLCLFLDRFGRLLNRGMICFCKIGLCSSNSKAYTHTVKQMIKKITIISIIKNGIQNLVCVRGRTHIIAYHFDFHMK